MDLTKLSLIFRFIIVIAIYIIIYYALKIMYKDIKGNEKKQKRSIGLEVINIGASYNLKLGSIIPVASVLTIGRSENNNLIINDKYVSMKHAVIKFKNNEHYIEDLNSKNGIFINNIKIYKKELLQAGDEIRIGQSVFKVI